MSVKQKSPKEFLMESVKCEPVGQEKEEMQSSPLLVPQFETVLINEELNTVEEIKSSPLLVPQFETVLINEELDTVEEIKSSPLLVPQFETVLINKEPDTGKEIKSSPLLVPQFETVLINEELDTVEEMKSSLLVPEFETVFIKEEKNKAEEFVRGLGQNTSRREDINERLIDHVRESTLLYDSAHRDYKDAVKKGQAWNDIADKLHLSVDAVKLKWKNIRDSYVKYLKNLKEPTRSVKKNKNQQWAANLEFLKDSVTSRPTVSNALESSETEVTPVDKDTNDAEYPDTEEEFARGLGHNMSRREDINERLIELVRESSLLYDSAHCDYKDAVKKGQAWSDIADKLHLSADAVKVKWKYFRDSYVRYVKYLMGDTCSAKKYKNWPWATHLEFLKDSITPRLMVSNVADSNETEFGLVDKDTNDVDSETNDDSQMPPPRKKLKLCKNQNEDSVDKILNYLQNKMNNKYRSRLDRTDHLFLSYADTFKKLSPKTQVLLKLKMSQMFGHAELYEMGETSPPFSPSSSHSSNPS